jgi:hypothetical protein
MKGYASFAGVLAALAPATALADSYSLFTVGVGTKLAYDHVRDYEGPVGHAVNAAIDVRLQLVRHLAVELGYAPMQGHEGRTELVFASQFRLGLLLYPVHEEEFGLYVGGGIGASKLGDVLSVTGDTNTYYGGAGCEIYVDGNFAIGASFSILVPGVASIERAMKARAEAEAETFDPANPPERPGIGAFLSIENFRVSLTGQYYF